MNLPSLFRRKPSNAPLAVRLPTARPKLYLVVACGRCRGITGAWEAVDSNALEIGVGICNAATFNGKIALLTGPVQVTGCHCSQ